MAGLKEPLVAHHLDSSLQVPTTSTPLVLEDPPPGNFTGISTIPGFFDSISAKQPSTARASLSSTITHSIKVSEAVNKRNSRVSKRKWCLLLRSSEVFLKFAEDIPLLEAMDLAKKVLVGRVRGRH